MGKFIYSIAIVAILSMVACTNSEKSTTTEADTVSSTEIGMVYTCPMHPEVKSDKPGTCHICKMDLVKESGSASEHMDADSMGHGHKH